MTVVVTWRGDGDRGPWWTLLAAPDEGEAPNCALVAATVDIAPKAGHALATVVTLVQLRPWGAAGRLTVARGDDGRLHATVIPQETAAEIWKALRKEANATAAEARHAAAADGIPVGERSRQLCAAARRDEAARATAAASGTCGTR